MNTPIARLRAWGHYDYSSGVRVAVPTASDAMLVNQNVTKHAVFVVARKAPDDYEIRAAAFLVFHMIEGTDKFELYAVTARHVIEKTSDKSCDGTVYLRLNALDDGAFYIPASGIRMIGNITRTIR